MNQPWYQNSDVLKYEVPKFVATLKALIQEKLSLIEAREKLTERAKKGAEFLSDPSKERALIAKGAEQLYEIYKNINKIDRQILDIEVQITATLEAKLTNLGFIINVSGGENEAGIIVEGQQINFVPWASIFDDEEKVIMTPEELWFFGRAKTLFNANPNNIEFIAKEIIDGFDK